MERSIITESSENQEKVTPVSDYTSPQTVSECDSISRTIGRKWNQDFRREIPAYADPIYRLPPKPTEIPTQVNPKTILVSGIDKLDHDINTDFEENPLHQEGVKCETYQRPDNSYFQEPPELQGLVSTAN